MHVCMLFQLTPSMSRPAAEPRQLPACSLCNGTVGPDVTVQYQPQMHIPLQTCWTELVDMLPQIFAHAAVASTPNEIKLAASVCAKHFFFSQPSHFLLLYRLNIFTLIASVLSLESKKKRRTSCASLAILTGIL